MESLCYTGLEADIFARESTVGTVWFVYAYQATMRQENEGNNGCKMSTSRQLACILNVWYWVVCKELAIFSKQVHNGAHLGT
ncbi:hypothetical protein XBJ1_0306 [Xenorhabdus bovienii SS-2004]|uniref:Uncharacterized protein n=2 Tax=Xenorhabdus bovienii TaxID=40576 RepID=D3UYS9_XENBS|nr:hypothetical protein XBJ1_0306 [Xenorhabdus bovienii SS-2004]